MTSIKVWHLCFLCSEEEHDIFVSKKPGPRLECQVGVLE